MIVSSVRSREDSPSRMEENLLGQAATGLWRTEDEWIAAFEGVTAERVTQAARQMQLDTVYFLTGKEAACDDA